MLGWLLIALTLIGLFGFLFWSFVTDKEKCIGSSVTNETLYWQKYDRCMANNGWVFFR
jgi:hypothetical protein